MAPFVGEIRMFGGNFAPQGWAMCDGALLPISENETLFQLIGTTYGGDGESTFALPDLRGRVPLHRGQVSVAGERGGVDQVTLTIQMIPQHTHALIAAGLQGTDNAPAGNVPAVAQNVKPYINQSPAGTMNLAMLAPVGGGQPHDNRQPYLSVTFIISLFGEFPHS
jgi:microcystin-dependent protein